jgi:dTDP-4-amino-4,6-dideoxygalactose transaminase
MRIPFNKPYHFQSEVEAAALCLRSGALCGNRDFGTKAAHLLEKKYGIKKVFLTPSCTAALEMGALLTGLRPGDEVILPSYTFSSTANAVVLQGALPVFCEIDPQTMNIDVDRIPELISEKTKMILPIDYAGIPCEIERIDAIARKHELSVMLDAAQSIDSSLDGRATGAFPRLAAYSFHESKNISCGEGGALCVNDESLLERAHFIQEKGTDRSLVLSGVKDKYTWVERGSSFLLSDILAAVLLVQLENIEFITESRSVVTAAYRALFRKYEEAGCVRTPTTSTQVKWNHHAFFVIFDEAERRDVFLRELRAKDIHAYIGYTPLHSSPKGRSYGYRPEDLPQTESIAKRIVRLPLYTELREAGLEYCIDGMADVLHSIYGF